jgi:hypothetical protein
MAGNVQGRDCIFKSNVLGTYLPVVCCKSFNIRITTGIVETTTQGTGQWESWDYDSLGYVIDLDGIIRTTDTSPVLMDLLSAQVQFVEVGFQALFIDPNGVVRRARGTVIIESTVLAALVGDLGTGQVSLRGSGELILDNGVDPCLASVLFINWDEETGIVTVTFNPDYPVDHWTYSIDGGAPVTAVGTTVSTGIVGETGVHNLVITPYCGASSHNTPQEFEIGTEPPPPDNGIVLVVNNASGVAVDSVTGIPGFAIIDPVSTGSSQLGEHTAGFSTPIEFTVIGGGTGNMHATLYQDGSPLQIINFNGAGTYAFEAFTFALNDEIQIVIEPEYDNTPILARYDTGGTAVCGVEPVTVYIDGTLIGFGTGVIVYTDPGLTTPLTGYDYIVDPAHAGWELSSATGEILSLLGANWCPPAEAALVRLGNDLEDICEAEEQTIYLDSATEIDTGLTAYEDGLLDLGTPVMGFDYIVRVSDGHIFEIDSTTGLIGADTGFSCNSLGFIAVNNNSVFTQIENIEVQGVSLDPSYFPILPGESFNIPNFTFGNPASIHVTYTSSSPDESIVVIDSATVPSCGNTSGGGGDTFIASGQVTNVVAPVINVNSTNC